MARLLLAVCLLALISPASGTARTWYITPDGTGDAPTIQAGISLAGWMDDVLLAPGTYYEHDIVMKDGVWLHSEWGPEVTTVDAQQMGRVLSCAEISSSAIIEGLTISGGSQSGIYCYRASPVIRGNIVRNNTCGDGGGGIYCEWQGSPSIVGNTIENNSASGFGGGVYLHLIYSGTSSSPQIRNNTISGNSAPAGGGIYCVGSYSYCYLTVSGNTIKENSAGTSGGGAYFGYIRAMVDSNTISGNLGNLGGGVHCYGSPPYLEIRNNTITGNHASRGAGVYCEAGGPTISGNRIALNEAAGWGGGLYCYSDSASITGNVLNGNTASNYGGGLSLYSSCTGTILGNTLVSNSAPHGGGLSFQFGAYPSVVMNIVASSGSGGGVFCYSATPVMSCNDIWGNVGGDAVCGTDAGGNMSDDPGFCNEGAGDYTIDEMSPCAPGNSPSGCDLIGALPVGCASAGVPPGLRKGTTWGSIKSMYR